MIYIELVTEAVHTSDLNAPSNPGKEGHMSDCYHGNKSGRLATVTLLVEEVGGLMVINK